MPTTRLSLDGYQARRTGSFAGRGPVITPIPDHPVGVITRLSLDGYGVRRTGSFAGRSPVEAGAAVLPQHVGLPLAIVGRMLVFKRG